MAKKRKDYGDECQSCYAVSDVLVRFVGPDCETEVRNCRTCFNGYIRYLSRMQNVLADDPIWTSAPVVTIHYDEHMRERAEARLDISDSLTN